MTYSAAIFGCGRMGAFTSESVREHAPACWFPLAHAEAVAAHGSLSLNALCDPSEESLARAMEHYGVGKGFASHDALLAASNPLLAGIATRTLGRAEIINDCVRAGVRALHVEKPLCNSAAELAYLKETLARDDIYITLGTVRRHFGIYKHALELAEGGDYGEPMEARVDMGRASMYWTHPHSVDLLLLAAGNRKLEKVSAVLGEVEFGESRVVIDNDPVIETATLHFEGGFMGHIGRSAGTDFHIGCSGGRVSVINDGAQIYAAHAEDGSPYSTHGVINFDHATVPSGTLAAITQLVSCLDGDAEAIADNRAVKQAIGLNQQVLFAMIQSDLEGGCPVSLEDVNPKMKILARSGEFYA